ncbi:MAG: HAD family hydrolase [Actinomycetota bacterium]|nr:HAD family hydrolase [Actinomycetota bacterium]
MTSHLDVVFLDVGGPIYGDRPYYEALWAAILEASPTAREEDYWDEFEAARAAQAGSFTRRLLARFVDEGRRGAVNRRAHELWHYPPDSLQADARAALEALRGRYRLGVLANQDRWIRETMARDGLDGYFDVWAVSEEIGADKPDPAIFRAALELAGAPGERCAMVGDRLDNDMAPARAHGMRTVWLLRGEAPTDPTPAQLAGADAAIRSLEELPEALARLAP